jgi:hypothetical protein
MICGRNIPLAPVPRVRETLLRCIIFSGRMSESGQFLPPSLATAMEELASTPDAKAHNRHKSF